MSRGSAIVNLDSGHPILRRVPPTLARARRVAPARPFD